MEFLVLEDKFCLRKENIFSFLDKTLYPFSLEGRESEPLTYLKVLEEIIWGKLRLIYNQKLI